MTLDELLKVENPELYDLKDENNYKGKDSLEKMYHYKKSSDGFDCDGTLKGKKYCKLIREIYRALYDWQDEIDKDNVKRYASIFIDNKIIMGPETMNSFSTTYNICKKLQIDDRELLNLFASTVGRIGNMTLTYERYNKNIACDYWDIKIKRQYLENKELSEEDKKIYINLFFQWDYVNVNKDNYEFKPFWEGHEKKYIPGKDEIPTYIKMVDIYTKRRGIFIIGMLRIAHKNINDYKKIRENIMSSNRIFNGYKDVICQAKKMKYSSNDIYILLDELIKNIEEIK